MLRTPPSAAPLLASTVKAVCDEATGVARLYTTVTVTLVPPLGVTPVTVIAPVGTPSVAATADANRCLNTTVWAAAAVSVPPDTVWVTSNVVDTRVAGAPQAPAKVRLVLAWLGVPPHTPGKTVLPPNSLALLAALQSFGVAKDLMTAEKNEKHVNEVLDD